MTIATSRPVAVARQPKVETRTAPDPAVARTPPSWAIAAALGLILLTFAARCWPVARNDAITSDETTHLAHILNKFALGDDLAMWELGAPRLPHLIGGYASYLALRADGMLPEGTTTDGIGRVVLSGMPKVLVPARCVAIGWGVALLGLVYLAAARSSGPIVGLIAAGLTSLVPECLAHSSIAGSDMPFTASAFLSLIALSRYVERPSAGRWACVAMSIGLAWAMRHTAIVLVAMAAVTHLVVAWNGRKSRGMSAAEAIAASGVASVAMAVAAFVVLWAGDGFGTITLAEISGRTSLDAPRKIGPVNVSSLPVPTSALSLVKQIRHQNAGHESYFLGEVRRDGWPSYFPVAFLLKTPTGLLALLVLAVASAASRWRKPPPWDALALAMLGLLWVMLVRNKVNIGVRYALLTYPLAMPFVARLFAADRIRDRVRGPLVIAATMWFAWASIGASARPLSFFNEIGGGPSKGWLYLADSNVDWGQDFDALGRALSKLGIREITTDISSERRLNVPGVFAVANPSKAFQLPDKTPPNRRLYDDEGGFIPIYTRFVAVSASRLMGLYSQNDMSWLRSRKLVNRVGDSIFIFDMDKSSDGNFCD